MIPLDQSAPDDFLQQKINDLRSMILYCARSAKFELGADVLQKFASILNRSAQSATDRATLSADVIGLYDQVARLIAPVTPASIALGQAFEAGAAGNPIRRLLRLQVAILSVALILVLLNPLLANHQAVTAAATAAGFAAWVWGDILQSALYFMIGVLGSAIYSVRQLYSRVRDYDLYTIDAQYYVIRDLIGGVMAFAFVSYLQPFLGDDSLLTSASAAGKDNPIDAGAIAFFAGYGVEIIYTGLDSLVGRLKTSLASLPPFSGVPAAVKVSLPSPDAPPSLAAPSDPDPATAKSVAGPSGN